MCPYYLDGDLRPGANARSVIPVRPRLIDRGRCGYCAVFKGRREGAGPAGDHGGPPAGTGLSKLNSMHGLELGGMPHAAAGAEARPLALSRGGARPGQVRSTF